MFRIINIGQTDSTNKYIRRLTDSGNRQEGMTIVADHQTAGRGQAGNSWESEAGKNLLFSYLLCPTEIAIDKQFVICQIASLAVAGALSEIRQGFSIKWPNDIYFGDKKIGGILIENDIAGTTLFNSIAGIGININQRVFTSNAPNPVSLYQITGVDHDLDHILGIILDKTTHYYNMAIAGEYEQLRIIYMNKLYRREGFHKFRSDKGEFTARIKDIGMTGILTLETDKGVEESFAFKEVQFII